MALDEALLESAVHRGDCSVRIYRWEEPTVSLGYFQKEREIDPQSPIADLPRVRRLSGGGGDTASSRMDLFLRGPGRESGNP